MIFKKDLMNFRHVMHFPLNSEFIMLYLGYLLMFSMLIRGLVLRKDFLYFGLNTIVFILYLALILSSFTDKENFRGGSGIIVWFYGWMFLLIHTPVLFLIWVVKFLIKRFRRSIKVTLLLNSINL